MPVSVVVGGGAMPVSAVVAAAPVSVAELDELPPQAAAPSISATAAAARSLFFMGTNPRQRRPLCRRERQRGACATVPAPLQLVRVRSSKDVSGGGVSRGVCQGGSPGGPVCDGGRAAISSAGGSRHGC